LNDGVVFVLREICSVDGRMDDVKRIPDPAEATEEM
jgi:hypothetical protein